MVLKIKPADMTSSTENRVPVQFDKNVQNNKKNQENLGTIGKSSFASVWFLKLRV